MLTVDQQHALEWLNDCMWDFTAKYNGTSSSVGLRISPKMYDILGKVANEGSFSYTDVYRSNTMKDYSVLIYDDGFNLRNELYHYSPVVRLDPKDEAALLELNIDVTPWRIEMLKLEIDPDGEAIRHLISLLGLVEKALWCNIRHPQRHE